MSVINRYQNGAICKACRTIYPDKVSEEKELFLFWEGRFYPLAHLFSQPAVANLSHIEVMTMNFHEVVI